MTALHRRIPRLGYALLLAWMLLFVVLVGHVWWDDPHRLQYVTADIWLDLLSIMIGVPLGVFLLWQLFKRFARLANSADP